MTWVVRLASLLAVLLVALASGVGLMGCESTSASEWVDASSHDLDLAVTDGSMDDAPDEEERTPDGVALALLSDVACELAEVDAPPGAAYDGLGPRPGVRTLRERPPEAV